MSWYPHVTVATVVEHENRFLMVLEETDEGLVYNQPAGHLEENESLLQAAERETLEETRWRVRVTGLLAISRYVAPANSVTYIRISFLAQAINEDYSRELDQGIQAACWMTYDEILEKCAQLRSPLVLEDIERYRSGTSYPLSMLRDLSLQ